jgi:FAD/FMN-containing dehydrogenase/Fe-S oxidoreductase
MPKKAELSSREFEFQLRKNGFKGEIKSDLVTRTLYSTDASIYQIEPQLVVFPKVTEDVNLIVSVAEQNNLPVTARGSGSGLVGQALGYGVIIDCSKYLNGIVEINPEKMQAVVEPGVILADLNRRASTFGLQFGPDPASAERATLGGCIANNATGAHSIIYGMTSDHVLEIEAVLADGNSAQFSSTSLADAERISEGKFLVNKIYRAALHIQSNNAAEIKASWPNTWRRVSGYNLNYLIGWSPEAPPQWGVESSSWNRGECPLPYPPVDQDRINLSNLFTGSEGTLGIITQARICLVPKPAYSILSVLPFSSIYEACEAVPELLQRAPAAIELIPRSLIDLARSVPAYAHQVKFLSELDNDGQIPEALLVLEFSGNEPMALRNKAMIPTRKIYIAETAQAQKQVWAVRKVGLGILQSRSGNQKPVAFMEDMAVPIQCLGDFVREIEAMLREHGTSADYYAHASAGCLHIRPALDIKSVQGRKNLRAIAEQAVEIALRYKGAISAEHGDGIARSEWLARSYGSGIVQAFKQLKDAADPKGLLNPGKIIDPLPMDINLRYGESYRTSAWQPVFQPAAHLSITPEESLIRAIEQCNGAGVCRKSDGVMCPSFQASKDEKHGTRGRANLLRAMISGKFPTSDLAEQSVREALDLCLACKGCKSECPSGVDIAKLKYEFFHHYYSHRNHHRPLRDYLFGYFANFARFGYIFRGLANQILQSNVYDVLGERILGLAVERKFPLFAQYSLKSQWKKNREKYPTGRSGKVIYLSDAFSEYFHPNAGMAALELLVQAGFSVEILSVLGAGRTLISKGFLEAAKEHAEKVIQQIQKIDVTGMTPIVSIEPSEIYSLRDEYVDFFPDDALVKKIAENAWMVDEFLIRPGNNGDIRLAKIVENIQPAQKKVLLHGHCYQKAQPPYGDGFPNGVEATASFLTSFGFSTELLNAGCCGMAGAFGYEKEHFEFSNRVGETVLLPTIRQAQLENPDVIIATSGVSCQTQIQDGTGCVSIHPIELAASSIYTYLLPNK